MSTSVKSRVATPAQAERAMSADLAFSSTRPAGWSYRFRSPAEVPRNVLVSSCSANPYSFRSAASAARSVCPSAAAKSRITPISVWPGGESQPGSPSFIPNEPGFSASISSAASSAGAPSAAACSASRTTSSIWSGRTPARDTTPAAAPSPRRSMAMTVSWRERDTPLVVSVLPAQRRLAAEVSSAITMQPSDRAAASARSTVSAGETALVMVMLPPLPRC